jgi:ligand-binding sensor domain-containing protein
MRFSMIFFVLYFIGMISISNSQDFWQHIAGGPADQGIQCMIIDTSGHIIVGTYTVGIYRSTDNGSTWSARDKHENDYRALAINASGIMFAGSWMSSVQRSTDNGLNWTMANSGMTNNQVKALAVKPNGTLFVSSVGLSNAVYYSTDNAASWNASTLTDDIRAFAFSTDGTIFAGASNAGIYRSTDNGATWEHPLTSYTFYAVAVNSSGKVFAGESSFGVRVSTDNGSNWSNTTLTNKTVNALLINSIGTIFAGTTQGVYQSKDDGANWTEINTGLTNKKVTCLALNPSGNIYAGTSGGIFVSLQPTTSVDDQKDNIPLSFRLEQNYPNPFNPSTTINYQLAESGFAKLTVFDLLGKEVAILVNEIKQPGTYTAQWHAADLPSGVYFLRLTAGSFSQVRKMLLMK